jgi:hypothetical protein
MKKIIHNNNKKESIGHSPNNASYIKFFKKYKFSLFFLHISKFIFEKLDCHLQYVV